VFSPVSFDAQVAGLMGIPVNRIIAGTFVLGSVLAAKSSLPLVNFCRGAKADGGAVICTSQLFGGKILSDVKLADGKGIVSIYPGAFSPDAGKSDKTPAVEKIEVPVEAPKVTFKQYNMAQPSLLAPSLEELIPEDHLVRAVNRMADSLDISPLQDGVESLGVQVANPHLVPFASQGLHSSLQDGIP
jgi:hypothetical protein